MIIDFLYSEPHTLHQKLSNLEISILSTVIYRLDHCLMDLIESARLLLGFSAQAELIQFFASIHSVLHMYGPISLHLSSLPDRAIIADSMN